MESAGARDVLGAVPTWLEIQGLSEESLRAAVTGLGIEILGGLCARAEPAPVRVRFRALSARTFTHTMYAELCRYMESWLGVGDDEPTVEEVEAPTGLLQIKEEEEEEEDSAGFEEEGKDSEDAVFDKRRPGCLHQGFHLGLKKTGMFASAIPFSIEEDLDVCIGDEGDRTFAFGIPSLIEDRETRQGG